MSSCSDKWAYQMSIVRISANSAIASRYAATDASVAARASALREPVVARRDREARRHPLHVVLERPGQRLVEVVQVEHQRPLGRCEHTEVREVRVAAELDVQPGRRRVLQVRGHDLRRAPVERERRDHHPPVPHRAPGPAPGWRSAPRAARPGRGDRPPAPIRRVPTAAPAPAAFPSALRSSTLGCSIAVMRSSSGGLRRALPFVRGGAVPAQAFAHTPLDEDWDELGHAHGRVGGHFPFDLRRDDGSVDVFAELRLQRSHDHVHSQRDGARYRGRSQVGRRSRCVRRCGRPEWSDQVEGVLERGTRNRRSRHRR